MFCMDSSGEFYEPCLKLMVWLDFKWNLDVDLDINPDVMDNGP